MIKSDSASSCSNLSMSTCVVNANIWPYNIYNGASECYCTLNALDESGGVNVVVLHTASKSPKCDDFTVVIFCFKFKPYDEG